MKKLTVFLAAALMLAGCSSKKTKPLSPEELYAECASGVVLVVNYYYLQMTLPNGKVYYYTYSYGQLTDSEFNIRETYAESDIATGLLISDDGKIIIPEGILNPDCYYAYETSELFEELRQSQISELDEAMDSTIEELNKVTYRVNNAEFWNQKPLANDITRKAELEKQLEKLQAEQTQWKEMSFGDTRSRVINNPYIRYNNSMTVTGRDEMEECEVIVEFIESAPQFSIIQLKSRTPLPGAHIFELNFNGDIALNQPLYAIGFAGGFEINKPVRAEFRPGIVVKLPVDDHIANTISTDTLLDCCPVLDEFGNLVGITRNFEDESITIRTSTIKIE